MSRQFSKKGDKKSANNYRPVSLTSIPCKSIEKIIRDEIVTHMKTNNLFSDKQFGFISGRSTVLQLLHVLDKWTKSINKGHSSDVIYMDHQEAFDTVPHRRLLGKLARYGIKGEVLRWVESFLNDRWQRVVVDGKSSEWTDITSGIPQGSVLGPISFVIYINDMPDGLSSEIFFICGRHQDFQGD